MKKKILDKFEIINKKVHIHKNTKGYSNKKGVAFHRKVNKNN